MGRIGVSYMAVEKVALEQKGRGIHPTVDSVRAQLGTGSRSTIGPYLKKWRSLSETNQRAEELPPDLYALTKGLYQNLQARSQAKIEQLIAETQLELMFLQEKLYAAESKFEEEKLFLIQEITNLRASLRGEMHDKEKCICRCKSLHR